MCSICLISLCVVLLYYGTTLLRYLLRRKNYNNITQSNTNTRANDPDRCGTVRGYGCDNPGRGVPDEGDVPAKNTLYYGRGGQLDRDTRGMYNTGRGAGCRMWGTSRPKTRSEFRSWKNLKIGYLKIHDPEKSAKKNYGLKKSRTFPPFLDSKILKFQKSGRSQNIGICKNFIP